MPIYAPEVDPWIGGFRGRPRLRAVAKRLTQIPTRLDAELRSADRDDQARLLRRQTELGDERRVLELFIGDLNHVLVTVPPGVWNGFKGIGADSAFVANCATIPHRPDEISRLDPFSDEIPYDWSLRHG